ncbi:hypothetical protein A3J90_00630 [candidate division WOR-1 bacterium RIFOXYC2_FULL_37_10]|uniref:Uncharacterized protein n=1 Tax=candidate division WOR-1 bacterium RIFOXYB2_FULL_37_13 TaxID=1802579 RepID=A0A1F4SKM8_UNCSA|nr:MAG: hypothetical protein A2310_00615 [candidate division WOR-1 bacterium RIFOXYB2_FULL_37_13]OGC36690.1 MAG: hypothetical protein A3J90_00630 [candidate division WOR-1 bacterium RIFOXYC2_FULL_37_10]
MSITRITAFIVFYILISFFIALGGYIGSLAFKEYKTGVAYAMYKKPNPHPYYRNKTPALFWFVISEKILFSLFFFAFSGFLVYKSIFWMMRG